MLISTVEAAKRLGISSRRVRKLVKQGRIRGVRVGRYYAIEEEDCHFERKAPGRKPLKRQIRE